MKRPPIVDRAHWGADESLVDDPAEYIDKVQAVYIHHTVGSNNYSCAESAALVRGIMTYHIQSEGWNDLGYNFLVDKCGQIFEGRAGWRRPAGQGRAHLRLQQLLHRHRAAR